jgi:phosphate transport system substrate-binding protein
MEGNMNKVIGAIIVIIAIIAIAIGVHSHSNDNKKPAKSTAAQTAIKKENVTITGAGSTFAAPLYGQLGSEYKAKAETTINYQAVGSGAGVAQFIANTVNFGATDVALKDAEVAQAQANGTPLNIPVAFGAVTVSYNVPGLKTGLKLDGPTIANIYLGTITNWNDSAIAKLNPGVKLPNLAIAPVYRSDGSGTTAQFTQFLTDVSPQWATQVGTNKTVQWPLGTGSSGNQGVAATTSQTKGAIGYVELAYALQNKFTTAAVKDKAGQYITPSLQSTSKAGDKLPNLPSDLRFTAINSPNSGAYPIASATFIVAYQDTCKAHEAANSDQATALAGWLDYLLGPGQQSMKKLEYAPLPSTLLTKAQAMVHGMTCNGTKLTD